MNNSVVTQEYVIKNTEYAENLLSVSNNILVFDLIKNSKEETVNEIDIVKGS